MGIAGAISRSKRIKRVTNPVFKRTRRRLYNSAKKRGDKKSMKKIIGYAKDERDFERTNRDVVKRVRKSKAKKK